MSTSVRRMQCDLRFQIYSEDWNLYALTRANANEGSECILNIDRGQRRTVSNSQWETRGFWYFLTWWSLYSLMTLSYVVPKRINNARENDCGPYYLFFCEFYHCSHFFSRKLRNYIIITIVYFFSLVFFSIDKIRIPLFFFSAINNSHIYICILYDQRRQFE